MIVTQREPKVLWNLYRVYKNANDRGDAFKVIKSCLMHNNMPVNIINVIKALKDVQCLVRSNWCHPVEFEYCLRYLSEVSGYSPIELENKLK